MHGGYIQVEADANAPVTGLGSTGSIGSVTIEVRASVEVTGVSGTGAVGTVVVDAGAEVPVSGLAANGQRGTGSCLGNVLFQIKIRVILRNTIFHPSME